MYWFRNDLRLSDNPAFLSACAQADFLLPVFIHSECSKGLTTWGFPRVAGHAKAFLNASLSDLRIQLEVRGSSLIELSGNPALIFQELKRRTQINTIYSEHIEAPQEISESRAIKNLGFNLRQFWQSSMLDPEQLPFELQDMPAVFSEFRRAVERSGISHAAPKESPDKIPPMPPGALDLGGRHCVDWLHSPQLFQGGQTRAQAHIAQYFQRRLVDTYKQTRNQLIGMDYSSKFSPWLALGCCSARDIARVLRDYELKHGANEGSYWLWFELLWRDFFRFLPFKYGQRLFHPSGLREKNPNPFNRKSFLLWSTGQTGENLIDAGMRELMQTGYLSNRMRQVVASYWIYDMKGDWQAGAAWFESQLVDYDVYSNQGNWLYIAGLGTDPRGGRAFNVQKQTAEHDPQGLYRARWLS